MPATSTSHVRLREVQERDLPIFLAHQLDPVATAMGAFESREREPFMAHWAKVLQDPNVTNRTIVLNGEVAGNIVCFPEGQRELIGYVIGREFWGRGVATAALLQFLTLIDRRPLFAIVVAHNHASMRVLEKAGFSRCEDQGADGESADELLFVLADAAPNRPNI
jgi:RimJ/RimL family protein N-acetyltransferase